MGQTLTHGVYLPDEGERNCYSGLAANWQILDTSVGTVAEHTSALAGKAPLVHTHTKSDITDFPAYGNAAGTICEGNDSRLSDARTPVAHTHTKSDVTDLLNSNFIPSANNSYDLGSSSYQWNNLYAKNYYYNGTAWGLDKANTWSAVNQYSREIQLAGDRNAFIAPMWEGAGSGMAFLVSDASKAICFGTWTDDTNNNNRKIVDGTKGRMIIRVGEKNNESYLEVEPRGSNTQLGNSSNKWKTLNGINPGALSFPDVSVAAQSSINVDTTNWDLAGNGNSYVVPYDGWFFIRINGVSVNVHIGGNSDNYPTLRDESSQGFATLVVPAAKNTTLRVFIIGTAITKAKFFPCLGNV